MTNKMLELMQIHDSAFPIGAYTHSFGMETYIQQDIIFDKQTLLEFCLSYLHGSLVYGDGLFVKETIVTVKEKQYECLKEIGDICHAMKIARESREGSIWMGQQFLKTVHSIQQEEEVKWIESELKKYDLSYHYPIIYGMYIALKEIDAHDGVSSFLYSSVASLVHNAVRSVPLGQTTGVQVIYELLTEIEKAKETVMNLSLEDASNPSIGLELASMQHEQLKVRLFIS